MNKIKIIAIKELNGYFYNPLGYVFAGLLLVVTNWLYWNDIFLSGSGSIRPLLTTLGYLLSLFVPALLMGAIAEEKKSGTYEILKTIPFSESHIVLGKFMAAAVYLLVIIGLTIPSLISLRILTNLDWGSVVGGYLGMWLLSLSYVSITLLFSTVTSQPIVSFMITSVVLIVNNLMSQDVILSRLPIAIKPIVESLSIGFRSGRFGDGVINLGDAVFLISVITVFLILAINFLKSNEK